MLSVRWIPVILAPLALGACASSSGTTLRDTDTRRAPTIISGADGVTTQIDTQRELTTQSQLIEMPANAAYRRVHAAFDVMGIAPTVFSERDLIVGRQNLVLRRRLGETRLSALLNCGSGITGNNADSYEITMTVFTQLSAAGDDLSRIATRVDASARPMGTSNTPVACTSTGRLEREIAERVAGDR